MRKKIWIAFLIGVCTLNVFSVSTDFFFEDNSVLQMSQHQATISLSDVQKDDRGCDEHSGGVHACHFGHCQFLALREFQLFSSYVETSSFQIGPKFYSSADLSRLQRPPLA
jgi:hypothetical protein